MKYYEVWFYYYGEDDPRNDYDKEFTFYVKTELPIFTSEDMVTHLRETFTPSEKYNIDQINCVDPEHYPHLSKWFEISAKEFTDGCGIAVQ